MCMWPPEHHDEVYTHSTGWVKIGWDTLDQHVDRKSKPATKQKVLSKKERRRIRKQERKNRGT